MSATTTTAKAPAVSPIARLIQAGKSAEGRLRAIHGSAFDIQSVTVSITGKGDARKVAGVSLRGHKVSGDAVASLSVGDAEALPAYQGLLRALQYMEVGPDRLIVNE